MMNSEPQPKENTLASHGKEKQRRSNGFSETGNMPTPEMQKENYE
jgi:hypothetical protein